MILTTCAACAAPLAHNAPRCVRCHVRYCNATCQHDHWRRGHKQMCKKIHRGGNAEKYHADKRYKEAVAEAVEACAEDTKGQKCYICLEAVHPRTGEGLVSGFCACRGGSSFAHISCLKRKAQLAMDEALENNLDGDRMESRWRKWYSCELCGQEYHGVVYSAMGWACWGSYLSLPETKRLGKLSPRQDAMKELANSLLSANRVEEALAIFRTLVGICTRLGHECDDVPGLLYSIASCLMRLGRREEALQLDRDVYNLRVKWRVGPAKILQSATSLTMSLVQNEKFSEARDFAREQIPVATRSLGPHAELTRNLRTYYAKAILCDTALPLDDVAESVAIFEDIEINTRRIFGNVHPDTLQAQKDMDSARMVWRARFSKPFPSKLPRRKTNDAKHEELMRKFELAK